MSKINVDDKAHTESIIGGGLSVNGDGGVVVISDHDNDRSDEPYGTDDHVTVCDRIGDSDTTANSSSFHPTTISNYDDDDNDKNPCHHVDSQEQHQHHDSSNNAQTVSFQIGPQHFDLIKLIGEGE